MNETQPNEGKFSEIFFLNSFRKTSRQYMEIYVPNEIAQDIIEISKSFHIDAQIVGRVEQSESKKLTIVSEYGTFEY